jgi:PAS domain S-box-containing protein
MGNQANLSRPAEAAPTAEIEGHETSASAIMQDFVALAEALPHIVWFDGPEGATQFVNRHWVAYTGLPRPLSLRYGMRQAICPDDLPAALELWGRAFQQHTPFEHELRLRRADGQYRWHFCRSVPVLDPNGVVTGWFGSATDIDERRRAVEQIQFQANLLNAVKQAVVVTDLAGTITYWNRFAEQLYGWPAGEALGRSINDLLPAVAASADAATVRQLLEGGESWVGELLIPRRTGDPVLVQLTNSPVTDSLGNLIGIIGVSSDITRRRRQEEQLHFLLDVSTELASSLDTYQTVQRVAQQLVPHLADWCAIDLIDPQHELELVALAHVDERKLAWAHQLRQRYPVRLGDASGTAEVIRTGQPILVPLVTPEMIEAADLDDPQRDFLRESKLRSCMILPLRGLGQPIGALTLIWSDSERSYTEDDVRFAEELAYRVAMAVDNTRLYAEAREAERQQTEVSALLESLLSSSPIGFAFFDRLHRYVRINEQLAAINGLPIEAHLGRPIREVLPVNAQSVDPILDQVFTTGEAVRNLEVTGETPLDPGVVRHWLTNFYPVVADGQTLYVGATVWEISERKRVEEALRTSEERFRSTFEQAAVGMAHVALDGHWVVVNNRLCEIVDYGREELLKLTFQEITYPEDLASDLAQVQRLVAGEIDGYRLEKRYIRRTGTLVWVLLTVSLQRNRVTGEPLYFIVVVEEINERKTAEVQLGILAEATKVLTTALEPELRSQALADLLVPQFADWCVVNLARTTGQIELVAAAHREAHQDAQLRALAVQRPLAADDADGTPQVIRTGQSLFYPEITGPLVEQDDRLALMQRAGLASLIIVPLRARGQTLGAMTLARSDARRLFTEADLHFAEELGRRMGLAVDNARLYQEARDVESQLRQLAETLEQRVAERTDELERSNRELDQFAYVASHDLKAPLRAIDNLSAWIEEDTGDLLPPASLEHLNKLRGRVQRMERLLDDLLAYSRAGRIQHRPEAVDLETLVRGVAEMQGLPPNFRFTLEGDLGPLYTLRVPLETVLRNLIGNAIKHHDRPDGHIQVTVCDQGDRLHFTVRDDGPGIAPQYHARIFEMFQMLQPRDRVEGSGMGLAIVKKLVESLGGQITLESVEGEGASFSFTWPRQLGEAAVQ